MESRFIKEGLKVVVFSQVQFSVRPIGRISLRLSFCFFGIKAFLERKPVANTNISYSSWFYVFICPIKITYMVYDVNFNILYFFLFELELKIGYLVRCPL